MECHSAKKREGLGLGVHEVGNSAKNREGNGARAAGSRIAMEETALEIAVREHWR